MRVNIRSQSAVDRLKRADTPTYPLAMTSATNFVGVGTTGTEAMLQLFAFVYAVTGGLPPANTRWLSIDADKDSRDPTSLAHQKYVRFLSTGKDGAGTVISTGYALASKAFPSIRQSILESMAALMNARDARFAVNLPPAQNQSLVVLAGSAGGTSGGTKDLVVTGGILGAGHIGLERFDVTMATIGGQIPWRDINRSVNADGRQRIMANFAESSMWRFGQMATHCPIEIDVPGQRPIRLPAATRIGTSLEFDWESASNKLQTNEQVVEMMSACLFQRFFTSVGCRRESRQCDDVNCGRTGQKHPLFHGVSLV
jgi:hypothetical protein